MSTQRNWSEKLGNLISFVEMAGEGLNILKNIVDDADDTPRLPRIPNQDETEKHIQNCDDNNLKKSKSLHAYQLIATSLSDYCNYLIENHNQAKEDLTEGSLPYVKNIYYDLCDTFGTFGLIKKTKWTFSLCETGAIYFAFLTDLISGETDLDERYSVDFFSDVSELWELVMSITDALNEKNNIRPFSSMIQELCEPIKNTNAHILPTFEDDLSPRQQRKLTKLYKKYLCVSSKELEDLFRLEINIIERNL